MIGTALSHYRILEKIGQGGKGRVRVGSIAPSSVSLSTDIGQFVASYFPLDSLKIDGSIGPRQRLLRKVGPQKERTTIVSRKALIGTRVP